MGVADFEGRKERGNRSVSSGRMTDSGWRLTLRDKGLWCLGQWERL